MSMHIINKQGKIIFSTSSGHIYGHFSDGLCCVHNGNKYGYIDQSGKVAIPYQFDEACNFKGGVARVKQNGQWGLINSTGKLICPYYHDIEDDVPTIHDGIICKHTPDKDYYIDINGNIVFDTSAYYIISDEFCNGYACVWNNSNECALINTKGDIVIPFGRYNHIGEVHCGVALVQKYINNKTHYGFINTTGIEVVQVGKYDDFFWQKKPDCAVVCAVKNEKCGYIDKQTGEELIACKYTRTNKSEYGISCSDNSCMINIVLKDAYPSEKDIYTYNTKTHKLHKVNDIDDISYYNEGLCAVMKNGKVGFIDENCELVIPFNYNAPNDDIKFKTLYFHEGVCAIDNTFIDRQGNIIKRIDETFSSPYYIGNGTYKYMHGSKVALVNLNGGIIFDGSEIKLGFIPSEFPIAVIDKRAFEDTILRFIDKDGKTALPYRFKVMEQDGHHMLRDTTVSGWIYRFVNGFAVVGDPINSSTNIKSKPQQKGSSSGCYIATAVYGSYDCPQVWTLRRFRDNTLDETWYGRAFIKTYYAISPTLVKWFGETNWFKKLWSKPLGKLVASLKHKGVEDTPYQDKY